VDLKFDYIYALPAFGYKPDDLGKVFMTKESDGIAMENMLRHLNENGVLDIIIPAKITFASQGFEKLRAYITEHFKGDCLLAVGDEELIKIHFHTNEPWKVLEYCASLGEIYDIVVEDMDRQSRGLHG
jgi:hypothetical protein